MVALALALQITAAQPATLAAARDALDRADTAAAVVTLRALASKRDISSAGVAALFLLRWIGSSVTQDSAAQIHRREEARYLHDWEFARSRGAPMDPEVESSGTVLWIDHVLETGKGVQDLAFLLAPCPGDNRNALGQRLPSSELGCADWRVALDSTAADRERSDPLLAGALWWIRLRSLLATLDTVADRPPRVTEAARCGALVCMRLGRPPQDARLLTALEADDVAGPALAAVGPIFARLARAPWPFDALGARVHVTVCALLRAPQGVGGCWPSGDGLTGGDAVDVRAMALAFRGQHALAGKVMEEAAQYFTPLDAKRDVVDPPDSAATPDRRWDAQGRSYVTVRRAPSDSDTRLPVDVFWRASWPLYLEPYNERLVVHRARLLLADLVVRAGSPGHPLFMPVGDPALIVRGGVPLAVVEGQPVPVGGETRRARIAYYPPSSHETVVRGGSFRSWVPLNLALVARGSTGWALTGFAAEDYDYFGPLDHQLVHYVRDGRREVDVYTSWARHPMCRETNPLLGLYLLDGRMHEIRKAVALDLEERPRKRFHLTLEAGTYVYSLELLDRACRRAERARYVIRVPKAEDAFLSDLMLADELYYGDQDRGTSRLRDRMPATISPGVNMRAGGTARFYWEMYGVVQDTLAASRLTVHFEIVNVREERVAVRDLGQVAAEARRARGTLDLSYAMNVPPGDGPLTAGLAVGIPDNARGIYVARLRVTDTMTGRTDVAERPFFVRE